MATPSTPYLADAHIDASWVAYKQSALGAGRGRPQESMFIDGVLDAAVFAVFVPDSITDQEDIEIATTYQLDWIKEKQATYTTKIFAGLENLRTRDLDQLIAYDVKYVTLVHNNSSVIAGSCTDPKHGGLTEYGVGWVRWLQDNGILVDVSHCSEQACWGILNVSRLPVIASHSGSYAVTNHPRNLSNELIKEIAATGGIIGVPLVKNFVGDLKGFYNHVEHIASLAGTDHVCVGSDLDGATLVAGAFSMEAWPAILSRLPTRVQGANLKKLLTGEPR